MLDGDYDSAFGEWMNDKSTNAEAGQCYSFLNFRQPFLISRAWLSDGSVVVPKTSSADNAFHQLLLTDLDLMEACRKGRQLRAQNAGVGGGAIGAKALCLEGTMGEKAWLAKTPPSWSYAQDAYLAKLPEVGENRVSLINEDDEFSLIQGPLKDTSLRSMPVVVYSSLDQLYVFQRLYNISSTPSKPLSLGKFRKMVKSSLATFASSSAQTNYAVQMLKVYEPIADAAQRKRNSLHEVLTAFISDLRGVCPSNAFAKRLFQASSENHPIYRILYRGIPVVLQDAKNRICDIPFFLNDAEATDCRATERTVDNEPLLKALRDFIHTGGKKAGDLRHLTMGINLPIESSFNLYVGSKSGLQVSTAGLREVAGFSACNEWKQANNERDLELLSNYARVN